jgi:HSP20 family molecular chaperone IbpA
VHISYQRNRLVVTWQMVHVTEHEEGGRWVRECKESKESRTIPLPEGTRVSRVASHLVRPH